MDPINSGPAAAMVRANLRRIREEHGVSLRDLSERLAELGHTLLPSGISRIEQGTRRVDVDDLVALSLALRISPLQLLLPAERRVDSDVSLTAEVTGATRSAWAWALGARIKSAHDNDLPAWVGERAAIPRGSLFDAAADLWRLVHLIEDRKTIGVDNAEMASVYETALGQMIGNVERDLILEEEFQSRRDEFGPPPGVSINEKEREHVRELTEVSREEVQRAKQLHEWLRMVADLKHQRESENG